MVTKDSKVSVAYKDLFLAHITHSLWPSCSCDLAVLPLEPRMLERHLSGTWPVIVAEEKKDTCQAIFWLLKLLPGRDEWHVNSHSIGQNQSHAHNKFKRDKEV